MIYLNVFFILFYYSNKREIFLTNSECITHSYAIIIHRVSILQAKTTQSCSYILVSIMT